MKTNPRQARRGFTLVELLVVIVIIAALAGLTAPQVIKMRKRGDLAEATNNAKQIGLGLTQFDADFGGYPDDSTVDTIKEITGDDPVGVLTGAESNAYFRQLIASSIVESEQPFFAKTTYVKSKPDDVYNTADSILEAGEVGFSYILRAAGQAIPVSGSRPVVVTPSQEGNAAGDFEFDPYDGKAIALFTDASVRQLNIRKRDNKAVLPGGKHVLEGGDAATVWGAAITPVMVAPTAK